jgi:hypothetical protein
MTGMDHTESAATATALAVTRRRLLAIVGASLAAAQISVVTGGPLGPSPAVASLNPPAYDAIIGLL